MFRLADSQLLMLLLLLPLLVLLYLWAGRMRNRALEQFGDLALVRKLGGTAAAGRRNLRFVLLLTTLGLLVGALARPQFGTRLETVKREGQDIVVVLDVSSSMLAEDVAPNRLEKAKHEISSLIDRLRGDRIGLVIFAGVPFVQHPLTSDYGAASMFLSSVDTTMIPSQGTALAEAVRTALKLFSPDRRSHRVIVLITDGEDHLGEPVEAAREAADQGVILYAVGIGSSHGTPIPLYDNAGNRLGFKRDERDQVVVTRLDSDILREMAERTGGTFHLASSTEVELDRIYREISEMEKQTLATHQFTRFEEQFQIFSLAALGLLCFGLLIPERKLEAATWRGRFQ